MQPEVQRRKTSVSIVSSKSSQNHPFNTDFKQIDLKRDFWHESFVL